MKDNFGGLRADRDNSFDDDDFAPVQQRSLPRREKNLALQIALGIWLGGVALAVTAFLAGLLFAGLMPRMMGMMGMH